MQNFVHVIISCIHWFTGYLYLEKYTIQISIEVR